MAGRDHHGEEPAVRDSGRLGFRYPEEPPDGRPVLAFGACRCTGCRNTGPFWADQTEQMTYEAAVESHRIRVGEKPSEYIARVSAVVTERYQAIGQRMPRRGMSRRERDARLAELRKQVLGMESK